MRKVPCPFRTWTLPYNLSAWKVFGDTWIEDETIGKSAPLFFSHLRNNTMTIGKFITVSAIFITAFTFCSCSKEDEDKNEKENGVDIETNAHEYIDLGLPSGTLWATCNVGANSPEEYGYYYAWGETMHKETYNWSTYKWCNGSENTLTKYYTGDNKKQLEPNDDVANINWGSGWFIPSIDQLKELFSYTTCSRIKLKGTEGIELKYHKRKGNYYPMCRLHLQRNSIRYGHVLYLVSFA